ncbi:MAG: response regulator [Geminicoccaceae bacterium]|nr:MAG: response regulator [Geminicoccaceae bacterium]
MTFAGAAGLRSAFAELVRRLSGRGDTEHEQALVRIVIVGALVVYAVFGPMPAAHPAWWIPGPLQLALGVFVVSLAHFAWIVFDPRVHEWRRGASMLVDHAGIVIGMAVGGQSTALLYPLLLWVTLGHGFRYGRGYLIGSALISVTLFTTLVVFHPFWWGLGPFSVGLVLALVLIPGYCLHLLTQLHDARRRAEASSDAKSRFLATMSHELRTPLHAILGMTELLRGTPLRPEQREMARTIHGAGHGLLNLIEDVLDIARIEAGAEPVRTAPFDVHRLALDVRDLLDHEARRKGLVLRLRLDAELPPHVLGPRQAVYQILVNLVANAVKFTEAGEVRLTVQGRSLGTDRPWLELVVDDTGVGIPEAVRARVFESFTQADDGVTRRYGGSGLGLAIVKRLAESAGGTVHLEGRPGGGSRFVVRLPIRFVDGDERPGSAELVLHGTPSAAQQDLLDQVGLPVVPAGASSLGRHANAIDVWLADAKAVQHLPEARSGRDLIVLGGTDDVPEALAQLAAVPRLELLQRMIRAAVLTADPLPVAAENERVRASGRSLDVLVADDHRVNQQVLERLLTRVGHRVVVVGDGAGALAALRAQPFDVAILDLNMPVMGGLDVAAAVGGLPDRPRLLALSADATPQIKQAATAAGFDAYLTKPVEGWRLLGELDRLTLPQAGAAATGPAAVPAAALDMRRLEMLCGLDDDDGFARTVIDAFIEDGKALVRELEASAARGDVAAFRDAAHALRSAATHLGATDLFARCLDTKRASDATLRGEATAIAQEVAASFAATAEALTAAKAKLGLSAAPAAPGSAPAVPSSANPADRVPTRARSTAR